MGLIFCGLAFVAALILTRRSLLAGLGAIMTTGYVFGIVRANYPDTFSHFIFDSAILGLYISLFTEHWPRPRNSTERALQSWVGVLLAWVIVMFLIPLQHPLIQLVGLRGNAFVVPCLLIGTRLTDSDGRDLATIMAYLNLLALGFGIAEYFIGVDVFFPQNSITEIIYRSRDLAGYTAYRIPSCFSNAHSYAGTMVLTLPWLVGTWVQPRCSGWQRWILMLGTGAALIGIFMAGARVVFVQLLVLLVVATFSRKMSAPMWIAWACMLAGIGYVVSGEERLQRFLSLADTEMVMERIEGSVNTTFVDILTTYPMGNGLGAGGTSIPFFLQNLLTDPMLIENEYGRILLEQGVVGLVLWVSFIGWFLMQPLPDGGHSWWLGCRLLWFTFLISFALAALGIGMMTSIPQSSLLFLSMGFLVTRRLSGKRRGRVATQQTSALKADSRLNHAAPAKASR